MTELLTKNGQFLLATLPAGTLLAFALMVLLAGVLNLARGTRTLIGALGCVMSLLAAVPLSLERAPIGDGQAVAGPLSFFLIALILGATLVTLLAQSEYFRGQRVVRPLEAEVLVMTGSLGAIIMASSANLLSAFLGLEVLSISAYALIATARDEAIASEASLKYFFLGAFSAALFVAGSGLIFSATGSVSFYEIAKHASGGNPLFILGFTLILCSLVFKVGAAPFHFWVADAYQGAPTSISGYMSATVKIAAFGTLLRVCLGAGNGLPSTVISVLWGISAISMTWGNFAALRQRSLKRLLAYSSVAHAGYALLGAVAYQSAGGREALLLYVTAYSIASLAAFGIVLYLTSGTEEQYERDSLSVLDGLSSRHPYIAIAMAACMLSLAGMPPFVGFAGKLALLRGALDEGYVILSVVAVLNTLVSLYYYFSVIYRMFAVESDPVRPLNEGRQASWGLALSLATLTALLLVLGLEPGVIYPLIKEAAAASM